MIISASRRTDIPAFYTPWFMERLREGYCLVPNPFNPNQVSRVSLLAEEVKLIVFWTRNPLPLMPYLPEMDRRGYQYYFLYTVMDNPRTIDRHSPTLNQSLETFQTLADRIGRQKVIWRYDPILFTSHSTIPFHLEKVAHISEVLKGYTDRCVISFAQIYNKVRNRLKILEEHGMELHLPPDSEVTEFLSKIFNLTASNQMEVYSCAQEKHWEGYGIRPGKCIDGALIKQVFQIEVGHKKDPSQRKACGCIISKDIGMYDTCLYECLYCYATTHFETARRNHSRLDPSSPSLIPLSDRGNTNHEKGERGIL
jgi:hypothetical protein